MNIFKFQMLTISERNQFVLRYLYCIFCIHVFRCWWNASKVTQMRYNGLMKMIKQLSHKRISFHQIQTNQTC